MQSLLRAHSQLMVHPPCPGTIPIPAAYDDILSPSSLSHPTPQNCDLTGCDLQQANLRGSNLAGAILEDIIAPLHMSQTVNVTTISIQGTAAPRAGAGAGGQGGQLGGPGAGDQPHPPPPPPPPAPPVAVAGADGSRNEQVQLQNPPPA